jgi:16S rRNA (cytosine1402-N4)-methyltransferase
MANESEPAKWKRRPRYRGSHPRRFDEKYKELNPEKYPETVQKVISSGKTPAGSHRPILLTGVLEALAPKPGETAVDATLGYGGHAQELLRAVLPGGKLIGFDADPVELPKTEARLRSSGVPEEAVIVIHSNFAGMAWQLAARGISAVDVVLADLGCSSMQLDNPARGFSFKLSGPLDLRMNPQKGRSAAELLSSLNIDELSTLLTLNADEPHAESIAEKIIEAEQRRGIVTTLDLAKVVRAAVGPRDREGADDSVRRVFQALRVAVNEEFTALETFLRFLPDCLNPGGRVAILTFHSGEDRRVKKAFQEGERSGIYATVSDEVIRPSSEEVRANPRASSAKLRWAVKANAQ